jgi:putative transcriptional regulator
VKNRLRELRSGAGLSQLEVATRLGVSRQTVISLESGRYLPSLPLAFRIGRLFELPIESVFQPEEEDLRA